MNTDTGSIYRGGDIAKAISRGEPVVEVSETVARKMETMNDLLAQAKSLAEDAEFQKRLEGTMNARLAIVAYCGGPWKKGMAGTSGVIDCPVCGGKESLRFSRAGYNGHIHAGCKTDGCVSWME